jgi:hypothetical protein
MEVNLRWWGKRASSAATVGASPGKSPSSAPMTAVDNPYKAAAKHTKDAMMEMRKIEIAALERAVAG